MTLLSKLDNSLEVISKDEFHNLMKEIISEEPNISDTELIKYLNILGEKFRVFYDISELNNEETIFINTTLKKLTNLSDYTRTTDLLEILFSFRVDEYYMHLTTIKDKCFLSDDVTIEILDALDEYQKYKSNID